MQEAFLLSRVLLRFAQRSGEVFGELSAAARTPDGSLWVGSDASTTVERLTPIEPHIFGQHTSFDLGDFMSLPNQDGEIDIEGMDYADDYVWLTGSHSTKRKKTRGSRTQEDIQKIDEIVVEPNRYVLARIPVHAGELSPAYTPRDHEAKQLTAATMQRTSQENMLIEALRDDPHLGPFLSFPLPCKENGFDIEGLAVHHNRLFLGLRGPVLLGWAIILDLEVEERERDVLTLKPRDETGRLYHKHLVYLDGLGIRDLCLHGKDLLVLAGPTLDHEGAMRVFRYHRVLEQCGDHIVAQESRTLEPLFDVPGVRGADYAEGLVLFPCVGQSEALLIVYDDPSEVRRPEPRGVFADAFKLP